MVYTIDRPFVFIHVPRTGGLSVAKAISWKKPDDIPSHIPRFALNTDLFSFGFVRNPWDRMVSLYTYMQQKRPDGTFDQELVRRMSFNEWLMEYKYYPRFDGDPIGSAWGFGYSGVLPLQSRTQMFWLEGCTYIGRYEKLATDLKEASSLGGFEAAPLDHINSSMHNAYRSYYDYETREFVAHYFRDEIHKFNYSF